MTFMVQSINTNSAASQAAYNLAKSSATLAQSLARLSSGSRLVETADDAAGMAVFLKTGAAIRRQDATIKNLGNAMSWLQTQAASLNAISSQLTRMSELVVMMQDITKSTEDLDNYLTEFDQLRKEMGRTMSDQFNGIDLLDLSGTKDDLTVFLDENGSQTMDLSLSDFQVNSGWGTLLGTDPFDGTVGFTDTVANLVNETLWGSSSLQVLLQDLASMLATNGALQSRLGFALDSVNNEKVNFEQAASRIGDTDVALETARLAKANILVQSGAAMLSQANASASVVLKLIQG
jgi:flagellin